MISQLAIGVMVQVVDMPDSLPSPSAGDAAGDVASRPPCGTARRRCKGEVYRGRPYIVRCSNWQPTERRRLRLGQPPLDVIGHMRDDVPAADVVLRSTASGPWAVREGNL